MFPLKPLVGYKYFETTYLSGYEYFDLVIYEYYAIDHVDCYGYFETVFLVSDNFRNVRFPYSVSLQLRCWW